MRIGLACEGGEPPAELLDLLAAAGLPAAALRGVTAAAVVTVVDEPGGVAAASTTWLLASGADIVRACDRGALDIGVVGKDRLLEEAGTVSELLDLRICLDTLVYATGAGAEPAAARPRVATRHPETARAHFAASGRQVELLEMEAPALAPALGLAGAVVELESRLPAAPAGAGPALVVRERIAACSARLVAGRAARALLGARLGEVVERLRTLVEDR